MKATKKNILHYLGELKKELEPQGIEALALFGSYAREEQTVYSDIDIAIKKKKNFLDDYTAYEYFEILSDIKAKIRKKLHKSIDIFDMDSTSSFKKAIEDELIYV
ncbi:MAG: Unknown protein [uncultured Sulfurovum sp.]|uniref:Polymerase beta nucleotidyltransferase domain-containing protein n=1 Tax=uncultured Sulfurovum sp. TaxID=269237 RepID=A0A6S6SXS9_9BACT|nr:MAG: Unknown protein [uncultured Sulfurovum sp.]